MSFRFELGARPGWRAGVSLAAALAIVCAASPASAEPVSATAKAPASPAPSATNVNEAPEVPAGAHEGEEPESPDSPRASMSRFLELAHAREFTGAAEYLDIPKQLGADGPRLAQRLTAVLDRYDLSDSEKLSPEPNGKLDDGLPPAYEQVGTVPSGVAKKDPVRLVRRGDKGTKLVALALGLGAASSWAIRKLALRARAHFHAWCAPGWRTFHVLLGAQPRHRRRRAAGGRIQLERGTPRVALAH
jgi:hypothetical protein